MILCDTYHENVIKAAAATISVHGKYDLIWELTSVISNPLSDDENKTDKFDISKVFKEVNKNKFGMHYP